MEIKKTKQARRSKNTQMRDKLFSFSTFQRLEAVISKEGTPTFPDDIDKLANLLFEDALEDFRGLGKEHEEWLEKHNGDAVKKLKGKTRGVVVGYAKRMASECD